jgi:hypothetical protein
MRATICANQEDMRAAVSAGQGGMRPQLSATTDDSWKGTDEGRSNCRHAGHEGRNVSLQTTFEETIADRLSKRMEDILTAIDQRAQRVR